MKFISAKMLKEMGISTDAVDQFIETYRKADEPDDEVKATLNQFIQDCVEENEIPVSDIVHFFLA